MPSVAAHEGDALGDLVDHGPDRALGLRAAEPPVGALRHDGRQRHDRQRREPEHDRDHDVDGRWRRRWSAASGPRKPNPIAKVALIVRTKTELAAMRWRRSTMRGMDVSSAGAKTAVIVATKQVDDHDQDAPWLAHEDEEDDARGPEDVRREHDQLRIGCAPRAPRPAALKATAGKRKVRIRTAFAVFEPVASTDGRHQRREHHVARQLAEELRGPQRDEARLRKTLPGPGQVALSRSSGGQVSVRHQPALGSPLHDSR